MTSSVRERFRIPSGMPLVHTLFGGWTALVFAFLYAPIVLLVAYSFNTSHLNIRWEGFTFEWYEKLLSDTVLITSLKNSLIVASGTTVLSVGLGTAGAWLLHRYRFPLTKAIGSLVFIPMVVPEIVLGISLLILFTMVNLRFEYLQGLDGMPDWFTNLEFGLGFTTLIISHVTFCFPFVLVAVQARLMGIDPSLEEAAMDLGAPPLKAFWHVIVPYMMPAIVAGALMSFTLSMDELIVTYFTSGPESATLPLKIFGRVKKGLDPSLNAISTLFIIAVVVMVIFSERLRTLKRPLPAQP
jgi:spermidine/putrescine transport system permease protein